MSSKCEKTTKGGALGTSSALSQSGTKSKLVLLCGNAIERETLSRAIARYIKEYNASHPPLGTGREPPNVVKIQKADILKTPPGGYGIEGENNAN